MGEKIQAKRTTPYGIQLEDESYMNTSEAVRNYLRDKLPAKLEIIEYSEGEKGKVIQKVKILSSQKDLESPKQTSLNQDRDTMMLLSYAKDIFVSGRSETMKGAVDLLIETKTYIATKL